MDRSAIAQVTCEDDLQPVKAPVRLLNGEEVQHGLGWMVASAVTSVQNRHLCRILGVLSGTLPWMAHRDDIGVSIHHLNGVEQGFALHHRGRLDIAEVHHIATEALHGRFKGHSGAGAGFKEQIAQNFALEQREIDFATCNGEEPLCIIENRKNFVIGQVVHRNQTGHGIPSIHSTSERHP